MPLPPPERRPVRVMNCSRDCFFFLTRTCGDHKHSTCLSHVLCVAARARRHWGTGIKARVQQGGAVTGAVLVVARGLAWMHEQALS